SWAIPGGSLWLRSLLCLRGILPDFLLLLKEMTEKDCAGLATVRFSGAGTPQGRHFSPDLRTHPTYILPGLLNPEARGNFSFRFGAGVPRGPGRVCDQGGTRLPRDLLPVRLRRGAGPICLHRPAGLRLPIRGRKTTHLVWTPPGPCGTGFSGKPVKPA